MKVLFALMILSFATGFLTRKLFRVNGSAREHPHCSQRESMPVVLLLSHTSSHIGNSFLAEKITRTALATIICKGRLKCIVTVTCTHEGKTTPKHHGLQAIIWSQNAAQQNMLLEPVSTVNFKRWLMQLHRAFLCKQHLVVQCLLFYNWLLSVYR